MYRADVTYEWFFDQSCQRSRGLRVNESVNYHFGYKWFMKSEYSAEYRLNFSLGLLNVTEAMTGCYKCCLTLVDGLDLTTEGAKRACAEGQIRVIFKTGDSKISRFIR